MLADYSINWLDLHCFPASSRAFENEIGQVLERKTKP
jgi:hypothetical protein